MTLDEYFALDEKAPAAVATEAGISEASLSRIRRGEQNTTRDVMLRIIAATGDKVTAAGLLHAARSIAPAHSASATNEAENIRPAAEEAAPRPFAHSSPTCSPTSGHAAPPQGSLACSTGGVSA